MPRHDDARLDDRTGRPAVFMEYLDGIDLQRFVARNGPLDALSAARMTRDLARVLAGFATVRSQGTPDGVVHGDVKPANVLLTGADGAREVRLCDLEHCGAAMPSSASRQGRFTGGTHGFAPPEAYAGAPASAAFDVFGLGCTLHMALSGTVPFPGHGPAAVADAVRAGRRPDWPLVGCPHVLRDVVEECLDQDPGRRPAPAEIVRRLDRFLSACDGIETLEAIRLAVLAGRSDEALAKLDAVGDAMPRGAAAELATLAMRRHRLLDRVGHVPDLDPSPPIEDLARALAPHARRLTAFLRRFPAHAGAREQRRIALIAGARLLDEVPPRVAELKQAARFDSACELIDGTLAALTALDRLGRIPVTLADGELPHPIQRDPARLLARARHDVTRAADEHATLRQALEDAERDLDFARAQEVVREFARIHGGASEVVAQLKDRLHRLEFFLERIVDQTASLAELEQLVQAFRVESDLIPLVRFVELCTRRTDGGTRTNDAVRGNSARALHRSISDLCREFPHVEPGVRAALAVLQSALEQLTARGAELLADARRKLATPPLPIRPLQALLARLDSLRVLDAIVDRPEQSAAAFLDELENVRIEVEQARAVRDRLARGAREAMASGHLTTAIYDMARAVDQFGDEQMTDPDAMSGVRLAEQFEEAKQRKRAIEEALREHHELTRRYAELRSDPASIPADRLVVLQEHEHVLGLLCTNLGPERAGPFREDLRALHFDMLRERSREGTSLLAAGGSPGHRLAIAQQTYDALQLCAPEHGFAPTHADQARRILDEWRRTLTELDKEARTAREAEVVRSRRVGFLRPWHVVTGALLVVLAFAIYRIGFRSDGDLATRLARSVESTLASNAPDALRKCAAELRASGSSAGLATSLLDATESLLTAGSLEELTRATRDFTARLDDSDPPEALHRALIRLGQRCVEVRYAEHAATASADALARHRDTLPTALQPVGRAFAGRTDTR